MRVAPERIVVCSGFTQALALLCRVLAGRGATTLATEAYGLHSNYEIVADQGLRARALAVDGHGAVVDDIGDADAVLVTPAHQFPLGPPLSPFRRSKLVAWAAATGGLVIEDDYDGEFRYDRQPIGALQALAPGHVVYVGTSSKTLAPGLRLGWMVLPSPLVDEVLAAKMLADRQTGSLDQLVVADLIASGAYDRHIRRSRLTYRRRCDRLAAELARRAPRVKVAGVAAGLHAVIELPEGTTEEEIVARAAGRGLAVQGLGYFRGPTRQPHPPALVVGYATPPDHAFTGAIARLCAVLHEGKKQ